MGWSDYVGAALSVARGRDFPPRRKVFRINFPKWLSRAVSKETVLSCELVLNCPLPCSSAPVSGAKRSQDNFGLVV